MSIIPDGSDRHHGSWGWIVEMMIAFFIDPHFPHFHLHNSLFFALFIREGQKGHFNNR